MRKGFLVRFVIGVVLLAGSSGRAEEKEKGKAASGSKETAQAAPFTLKVPVDVVIVSALVTDKKGNPVKDLTIRDFTVLEDGKPQPIHTFSLESYKTVQIVEPSARTDAGEAGQRQSAEGPPLARYISLFMDDLMAPSTELYYYSVEAMKKYLAGSAEPDDLICLGAASGRVQFPFTSDKKALLENLGEFQKKLSLSRRFVSQSPPMDDLQAQRLANFDRLQVSEEALLLELIAGDPAMQATLERAQQIPDPAARERAIQQILQEGRRQIQSQATQQFQEAQYQTRLLLAALKQHLRSLRHIQGHKSLVLFSGGFLFEELRYEMQEICDNALRAGVVINVIDPRGLYTSNLQASERVSSADSRVLVNKLSSRSEYHLALHDPLHQMASETGGLFYHNSNDLHAGLKAIAERESFLYVLTYASPNPKNDGRYHKIKVEIARPGLEINYRKGYYAPKEERSFERHKKEDILEALRAPGNYNEIPLQLSYNFYQLDDVQYQLSLLANFSIRGMKFQEENARHSNLIHLVVGAFDEKDRYVDGLEKAITLNLLDSGYTQLLQYGFTSKVEIKVPPGQYKIKAVVREGFQAHMGSITKLIQVP